MQNLTATVREEELNSSEKMAETNRNGETPLLRSEDGELEKGRKNGRPKEPWKGEVVKSIVYAGLDAIVTSFSLISSISAGRLSSGTYSLPHFSILVKVTFGFKVVDLIHIGVLQLITLLYVPTFLDFKLTYMY